MMFEKLVKSELNLECVAEYRFHPIRKWRADYAILAHKILIEVEGGIWLPKGGRHNRGVGYVKDLSKYNTATSMGWSILRVQPKELLSSSTLEFIKETIKNK